MAQQLANSVIRVLNKDGKTIGTGFLIAENLAVTCSHVIEIAGEGPGGSLRVQFYQDNSDKTYFGTIQPEGWSSKGEDDVAFLKLDNVPKGIHPLNLGEAAQSEGHTYTSLAYTRRNEVVARRVSGSIHGLVKKGTGQGELLQLTGDLFDAGSSGAPVLDTTLDQVVGMVVWNEDTQHVRIVYAIPGETLLKYISILLSNNFNKNYSNSIPSGSGTFTILHLADLEFGKNTEEANSIRESFLKDLSNVSRNMGLTPNLILVTGDIAYSGQQEEYRQAIDFFKKLLDITNIPPQCILLVPGNHDLCRSAISPQSTLQEFDNRSLGELDNLTFNENPLLSNYLDFTRQLFGTAQSFDYGGILSFKKFGLSSDQISFLFINTAGTENDISEFFQRWTGNQLLIDLENHRSGTLRIALVHHPIWRQENSRDSLASLLQADCDLVFLDMIIKEILVFPLRLCHQVVIALQFLSVTHC